MRLILILISFLLVQYAHGQSIRYVPLMKPSASCVAPTSITGTALICAGATTALSQNGSGGGTWSSSSTTVATVTSGGVVTGVQSASTGETQATAVITYTNTCGSATKTVSVNSTVPTFTLPSVLTTCATDGSTNTVTYRTQSGKSGYSYTIPGTAGVDYIASNTTTFQPQIKWYNNSGTGAAIVPGAIGVTYTGANGCANVTPAPSPIVTVNYTPLTWTGWSSPTATGGPAGNDITVTVHSTALVAGSYTVTYNLSAPNSASNQTASMTFSGTSGTFTVPGAKVPNSGSQTITVTKLTWVTSSCVENVSTNNFVVISI